MATINGDSGNDFIHQSGDGLVPPPGFAEILGVTAQGDEINAGGGDDRAFGRGGDDTLNGGGGIDQLYGGNGNDLLDGGTGADRMEGGAGNDFFVVDNAGDVIREFVGGGQDTVSASISLVLADEVEVLILTGVDACDGTGNGLDNVIWGNVAGNVLAGAAGNDLLIGGEGDDLLDGGADNDTLQGDAGNDTLIGGTGNDTFHVNGAGDLVQESAGEGTDTVISSVLISTLGAEVENLVLALGAAQGLGNSLSNIITDNEGSHQLFGREGDDTIYGGAGNDGLHGESGANVLDGGSGNDTYYIDSLTDSVVEAADGGTDTILATVSHAMGENVENLVLAALAGNASATGNGQANNIHGNGGDNVLAGAGGADLLYGGLGRDALNGGAGDDQLQGGDSNDTLTGLAGADTLEGGTGDDLYILGADAVLVNELDGQGNDTLRADADHTLAGGIEALDLSLSLVALQGSGNALHNLIWGNGADNVLRGLAGNDSLYGGLGNDFLEGGDNADLLDGGAGNDTLAGGQGDDVYEVVDAADTITELSGAGNDLVISSVDLTLAAQVERLTLAGAAVAGTGNAGRNLLTGNGGDNLLSGLAGADTLRGGAGADHIFGGGGADSLDGEAGADTLEGGLGNDTYVLAASGDVVTEVAGGGKDTLRAAVSVTLGAFVENLVLTGGAALNGTGNGLANRLTGNTAANALQGMGGADTLRGGGGADDFVFRSVNVGVDVILDFNDLDGGADEGDQIALATALITGSFAYIGAAGFSGGGNTEARVAAGQVLIDLGGDGTADITLTLNGLTSDTQLSAGDFAFV